MVIWNSNMEWPAGGWQKTTRLHYRGAAAKRKKRG